MKVEIAVGLVFTIWLVMKKRVEGLRSILLSQNSYHWLALQISTKIS
jgi:hypothetical protein